MNLRALLLATLAAAAIALPARAELSQAELDAATTTLEEYAKQMTDFLPCAPMIYSGAPKGGARFAEEEYGERAVLKVIGEFIQKNNGSRADERELILSYVLYAQPQYVQDVRTLVEFCVEKDFFRQAALLSGASVPLTMRSPFNGK